MTKQTRPFPLVADSEPVFTSARQMQLYDDHDLITNIKGYYEDKAYEDDLPVEQAKPSRPPVSPHQPVFEPAERARQEARADLKKKRQALVTADKPHLPKVGELASKPSVPVKSDQTWGKYAQKLRQDSYILAELPQTYDLPTNRANKDSKKNNYDFLKRSQIYNQEANQRQKERQVAQELNLSPFEDSH